ncbi:zinc-binding alcohol dehydrogenase family protein [Jiella pacifica]|uniref:Zinc-type alcohol dehydrogenase-like protein n=1 Tax=Jiella pacifica TaxID=2696469 RepID=A0A6N9T1A4_9HYPH|nr:zinc-binding alcohol dehydrogenase family protein [Jiella pacifica]NDW05100.1 zinc-binding alcohol dehydrogenase family protein [Jiella pacifica]
MKALAYEKAHALDAYAIQDMDVAEPKLRDSDLLIDIRAIGLNPGEALIRSVRSAERGGRVILGWEFTGVVLQVGPNAKGFAIGDRVMGTGDVTRDGCWAERLAVDHRVVAKVPDRLAFVDAASLPIGGLTAWEAVFRDRDTLPAGVDRVLVVGGAGGVGSMAIQLLKAKTDAFVIATASRPESKDWCEMMGADLVVDHSRDVIAQLGAAGIDQVDMVFSTAGTAENLSWFAELLRPFGHLSAVDIAPPFDASPIVSKSISLHTEMVFAKVISGFDLASQGKIHAEIADRAVSGGLRTIVSTQFEGLTAENMKTAHEQLESRRTVGKIVIVV